MTELLPGVPAQKESPSEETPTQRRRRRGVGQEEIFERYPNLRILAGGPQKAAEAAWIATFTARPDAMQALLADYIKQLHIKPGRVGQRPMPKEADVDFAALTQGEVSAEPLIDVLPGLISKLPPHLRPERSFASAIHMSKTQLRRLLHGEYEPTTKEIELIASVVGKPPAFFVEYRQMFVVAAMVNLMQERPHVSTVLYREYLKVHVNR